MAEFGGPRVVVVGHCVPDSYALKAVVASAVPGAVVEFVNDDEGLLKAAVGAGLLLVNRILEGDFADESGVRQIARLAAVTKVMLVSNYAEAQAEAEKAGAVPGFGKRSMHGEDARRRLKEAIDNT